MKKIIIALIFAINITIVNAQTTDSKINSTWTYENKNGIIINENNYDKIKEVMTLEELENIDENIYKKIENSDKVVAYETITIETKYIKIGKDNFVINNQILNENTNISTTSSIIGDDIYTTTYKQLHLWVFLNDNGSHTFVIQNSWKKIPTTKSFDVIALRWEGSVVETQSSTYGEQIYKNTTSQVNPPYITYQYNNGNYNYLDNGVGLSQNLVNGDYYYVNQLEITAYCSGTINVYGTYQHAQNSLTLTESKSYTLNSSGLGNVLYYSNSTIRNSYDNMQGISVSFIA